MSIVAELLIPVFRWDSNINLLFLIIFLGENICLVVKELNWGEKMGADWLLCKTRLNKTDDSKVKDIFRCLTLDRIWHIVNNTKLGL